MKIKISKILIVVMFGLFTATTLYSQNNKTYKVQKASSLLIIDGKANETDWQKAEALTFTNFYRSPMPDDKQSTTLKMLWDDSHIYLLYECKDKFITANIKERDGFTFQDDCAEIFLIPTEDKIKMHFGFELNLYKIANDFVFLNDIHKNERIVVKAYSPEYKVAVTIDGTLNDNSDKDKGWIMEFAIPFKAFHTAGATTEIVAGAKWSFMAARQDRNELASERVSTSTVFPLKKGFEDIHNPKNFGLIEFIAE